MKVISFFLLHYYVSGKLIQNQPVPEIYGTTKAPQQIKAATQPGIACAPDKSLNSKNDIKVMIAHIYNETFLDKIIKQNYHSKAEAIRDKHLQNLNFFNDWFNNQPERLKNVLQRLDRLKKDQVEPVVAIVAGVLSDYPKLEILFNDKNNKTNELLNKLNRFNMICKLNCEDQATKEHHNIAKRNVRDEFYCSSLEDLHNEITQNLDQLVKKLNHTKINELSLNDKLYKDRIEKIKSKLKDKALKEFGRTMYDVLSLEDEYQHFMDDITSTDLYAIVYAIKSLGLHIDTNLLQLEQAVEIYGQQCYRCGANPLVRHVRKVGKESQKEKKMVPPSLVKELIEIKFKEISDEIENDWKTIFNELDSWIQRIDAEEVSLAKFKPLQDQVNTMTNAEREALDELKELVPRISINQILELVKNLQDLLKRILDVLNQLTK
ncbi:jg25376 [Pararge aegeria aegeria]|uniref:Jg25376 protein n=2 Tax=Pararge aegeria TaxID=116150 RepID=A0A8S4S4T7_9NEOP|nr:jg25376 [Pararge aegeria aegeria]